MMMTCRICHRAAAQDQAHDALACLQCDTWIELACDTLLRFTSAQTPISAQDYKS